MYLRGLNLVLSNLVDTLGITESSHTAMLSRKRIIASFIYDRRNNM